MNEAIDRMRHSATRSLLERDDVIIVASVSCLYGIGSVETYSAMTFSLKKGMTADRGEIIRKLVALQYKRNDMGFARGNFRVRGDSVELFPSHYEDSAWRLSFFGDEIESITEFDPLTGQKVADLTSIKVYANSHYVTPGPTLKQASEAIRHELTERLKEMHAEGKLLEAQRLEQRTNFDLEMIAATGSCAGIENYSRFLTGRLPGEPPPTLFEYLPENALLFVDESHVTVPQIGGMSRGDHRRKLTLAEYGFRLPSCIDNRPLRFEEWEAMRPQTVFVSATPGKWEMEATGGVFVEQVIRPTGLIDPPIEIKPVEDQVEDCIAEARKVAANGYRTLVTTLTKRMAEDLTEFMHEAGLRVRYMHSDVETLERIELIRDLRLGVYDVLVGINLLREGLDIPECGLVAIMDADKEGFLRSETSLIQTIGRAARNVEGRVILYADSITGSMERAMAETDRRRAKQEAYNAEHGITPTTIKRNISDVLADVSMRDGVDRRHRRRRDAEPRRPQPQGVHRRPRKADADRRRQPRLRNRRRGARSDPPPRSRRPRAAEYGPEGRAGAGPRGGRQTGDADDAVREGESGEGGATEPALNRRPNGGAVGAGRWATDDDAARVVRPMMRISLSWSVTSMISSASIAGKLATTVPLRAPSTMVAIFMAPLHPPARSPTSAAHDPARLPHPPRRPAVARARGRARHGRYGAAAGGDGGGGDHPRAGRARLRARR